MLQSSGAFTDELGYSCEDWTPDDCTVASDSLTAEGTAALLKHCPVICGVCEKTDAKAKTNGTASMACKDDDAFEDLYVHPKL